MPTVGLRRNLSECAHGNNKEHDNQRQEYARRGRDQPT